MAKVVKKSGVTQCKVCFRTKEEAVDEQLSLGKVCGCANCVFAEDIQKALLSLQLGVYCVNCGEKFYSPQDVYCSNCGCKRV